MLLKEDNEQIAHFHPKSDRPPNGQPQGHNWGLDWDNMWLACKGGTQRSLMANAGLRYGLEPLRENRSCDEAKGDEILDGVILAPGMVPPFPRVFVYRDTGAELLMSVDPAVRDADANLADLADRTIEKLNLNCNRLSRLRRKKYEEVDAAVRNLQHSRVARMEGRDAAVRNLLARYFNPDARDTREEFFTVVRWALTLKKFPVEDHLRDIGYVG